MNIMKDEPRDTHMRYRHPKLIQNAGGRLLIVVDEVVNKTRSAVMPKGWEQQETGGEELVAVLLIEDRDRRESWLNCGALIYDQRMPPTDQAPH